MNIALDGMGGDFAPANPVAGALEALEAFPEIESLLLVGQEDVLKAEVLRRVKSVPDRLSFVHCTQVVGMNDPATDAIRRKRDSSITRCAELVAEGRARAMVSAGHTGAAVAAAYARLRCLEGVDRPGIATILPTEFNRFVLIDAGANIDPKPFHLCQYAVMGATYSERVLGFERPSVGLMSIGTEEAKGNDLTREAYKLLSQLPLNFRGNIEGHDLYEHPVEVVVSDGFTGNVVLKTSESIANAMMSWLKNELTKTPLRKLGALLARGAFESIKTKTSYEEIGGSPLLGVNGVCIISHGSSSPLAIRNAIRAATQSLRHELNPTIVGRIEEANRILRKNHSSPAGTPAPAPAQPAA